jgi:inosine/xanthosine triphosphatase
MNTPSVVAVGSTNRVKVEAVRLVISAIWPSAQIRPVAVASGVPDMPMSDDEGRRGALQRAESAMTACAAQLGFGLEGAVAFSGDTLYVTNWVAVVDQHGHTSVTNGGRLPLPQCIAHDLMHGHELGPLMDRLTGESDSKQHMGAAGYLTRGLVPRTEAFRIAVAYALAPFLSPELYSQEAGAAR